jgi:hypothetical protein
VNNELVTKKDLLAAEKDLALALENVELSLTIRLGSMIAAGGVAALVVLLMIH